MTELFSEGAARMAGRDAAGRHLDWVNAYGGRRNIEGAEIDVPGQYAEHVDAFRDGFMTALSESEE